MPQLTTTVTVDAPVDQVFALFSDIPNATRIPGIVRIEMLTPGAVRRGTRFRETRKVMGTEATEQMEVTDWQPGRSYTLACTSHGATHTTRFDFVPHGGGTRVRLDYRMDPHTLMARVMGKMMMGTIRRCMNEDAAALKALAEGREVAAAG